jgi:hypothetical protein
MKAEITEVLKNVKDYNLYYEDSEGEDIIEEYDNIYDLFYELTIQLFNDYLSDPKDLKSDDYVKSLDGYYIKSDRKIPLKEFIQYIYLDVEAEEWHLNGDEHYWQMLGI